MTDGNQFGLTPGDPPCDDVGGLSAVLELGDPAWSTAGQREAFRILVAYARAYPGPQIEPPGLRDAALGQASIIADRVAERGVDAEALRREIAEARERLFAAETEPASDEVGRHPILVALVSVLLLLEIGIGVLVVLYR
jgi:hypothetical protein